MNSSSERRADTLNFKQSMLLQLGQMAKGERCEMLAYLIDMSYVECSDLIRQDHALAVNHQKRDSAA